MIVTCLDTQRHPHTLIIPRESDTGNVVTLANQLA